MLNDSIFKRLKIDNCTLKIQPMFLDIGLGIFAAMAVSAWYDVPLTLLLAAAGIVLALLPDADFLFSVMRRRSAVHHRDGLHYPLLYILIGGQAAAFFGQEWLSLFVLCSLAHFIHDSIGIGWGVQWLFPLVKDHYAVFYIYKPRGRSEYLPRQWLYRWKHEDIDALDARYGDPQWIRNVYVKWHPYAIIEAAVCVLAIAALISYGLFF